MALAVDCRCESWLNLALIKLGRVMKPKALLVIDLNDCITIFEGEVHLNAKFNADWVTHMLDIIEQYGAQLQRGEIEIIALADANAKDENNYLFRCFDGFYKGISQGGLDKLIEHIHPTLKPFFKIKDGILDRADQRYTNATLNKLCSTYQLQVQQICWYSSDTKLNAYFASQGCLTVGLASYGDLNKVALERFTQLLDQSGTQTQYQRVHYLVDIDRTFLNRIASLFLRPPQSRVNAEIIQLVHETLQKLPRHEICFRFLTARFAELLSDKDPNCPLDECHLDQKIMTEFASYGERFKQLPTLRFEALQKINTPHQSKLDLLLQAVAPADIENSLIVVIEDKLKEINQFVAATETFHKMGAELVVLQCHVDHGFYESVSQVNSKVLGFIQTMLVSEQLNSNSLQTNDSVFPSFYFFGNFFSLFGRTQQEPHANGGQSAATSEFSSNGFCF